MNQNIAIFKNGNETAFVSADWPIFMLLALGAIKEPVGIPLYLNFLLILVGGTYALIHFSLNKNFLPIMLLILLGMIAPLQFGGILITYSRLIQLTSLVFVASYISHVRPKSFINFALTVLLPVILSVFLLELIFESNLHLRLIEGEFKKRFVGIIGDPNFNSMLYGLLAIFAFYVKRRLSALFLVVMALLGLSRGFVIALLVWCLAHILRKTKLYSFYFWSVVIGIVMTPLILFCFDQIITDQTRLELITISSHRYGHWMSYLNIGLENPFGVGYFQGTSHEQIVYGVAKIQQAHSLTLQVWSEFGYIGYIIFAIFLIKIAKIFISQAREKSPLFLYILTGYSMLNALSEWALWVGIGILLAISKKQLFQFSSQRIMKYNYGIDAIS